MARSVIEKPKKTDDEALLEEALTRYESGREAEAENRKMSREDWDFATNLNHWPPEEKRRRKGRPCLTIDKLGTFLHQVTNDQRQNRPAIKIRPFDDQADKDTARVLQGLIRHIEYSSRAYIAYDTAYEHAVTCGIGFLRVLTKIKNKATNEQEIYVQRINNWDSVTLDPDHQEPDGSDAMWGFVEDEMDRKAFEKAYPKVDPKDWESQSFSAAAQKWIKKDSVKVAEYFKVIEKDGDRSVMWYKICGSEILDSKPWPGKNIPLVVVYGEEKFFDGKRLYSGLVRRAKDSQRMYNYWASTYTEVVAMAPKAKWTGTVKQFEGLENEWAGANTDNKAFLPYNSDGTAPPPSRIGAGEVPAGISQGLLQASEDIKATTGIFDASLGRQGNETSGKAIMARQREGDTANYHFLDNLTTSINYLGKVLIDLIPQIYDTARIVRILGEDGQEELVGLNMPQDSAPRGVKTVVEDLSVGQYDVVVEVGPAYATKRQEAAENLMSLLQSVPIIGQVAGDLIIKTLDVEGADEIAARIRNSLPPNLTAAVGPDGKPVQGAPSPELMAAQQQMQAMGQQMQQMQQALQQAEAAVQDKGMERDTRLQEAEIKRQTELVKAQADLQKTQIEAEVSRMQYIPTPDMEEAEAVKTQAIMEQLSGVLQQSAAQQMEAIQALAQMQAQAGALQMEMLRLLTQPKQVQIQRGADGRIEGAIAVAATNVGSP